MSPLILIKRIQRAERVKLVSRGDAVVRMKKLSVEVSVHTGTARVKYKQNKASDEFTDICV